MQLVHAGNVFPMQNCHSCNLFSFSFVYQSPWHRGFFHCNFFCLYTEMTSEKCFAYVCIVHHLMFEYKWNMYPILFCLWIRKAGCKLRRVYLLVLWMLGGRWVWKKLFFKMLFSYYTGLHWKAKGRNPGCGDCGVWLGIHFAYSYHSQHDAWRTSREVWEAEHRGPDHVNQWDQLGWFTTLNVSEHYKGKENISGSYPF